MSTMDPQSQYPPHLCQAAPVHRYPTTSSAFSASANPNEDWTKITDLAERRRIQNRIAQRNYRKKLKKRLEELEKRAASSSASPEQQPAELEPVPARKKKRSASQQEELRPSSFECQPSQAPLSFMPFDDGTMFSEQYTRQLSTSPPPLIYSGYGSDQLGYSSFAHDMACPTFGTDPPIFPPELPPFSSASSAASASSAPIPAVSADYPIKQEFLHPDLPLFHMGYQSFATIDISSAQNYPHSCASLSTTPPLSDCFEHSVAGSPPELSMPTTPPYF